MNAEQTTNDGASATSTSWSDRSPDEIEQEIEHTRQRLSDTMDALQGKLSPRERLQAATDSAAKMGKRFARAATDAMTPDITTMIRMDHTHALALFRRFRPGTSLDRKRALAANACLALEIHAQLEEEIFYPALAKVLPQNETLEKSVPEHDEMRTLIAALRASDPADPGYDATFHALMRAVLHHVADEESVLLPQAEELLGDELGALGLQMTKRRMELLKPHLAQVAATTARSFPLASIAVASSVLAIAWLLLRPSRDSDMTN
jgi:hypothetical protein